MVLALAAGALLLPAACLLGQLTPVVQGITLLSGAGQQVPVPAPQSSPVNRVCGYLGVGTQDIDTKTAAKLKLASASGAEIIEVDHDAPAAKAGLRIHDVILSVNGQRIAGVAQLRRVLRDTKPGAVAVLVVSRAGQQHTMKITLANRSRLEAKAWAQHIPVPEPPSDSGSLALPDGVSFGNSNGFLSSLESNPLYTGLHLDVLGRPLARFFGVLSGHGLLVRRVDYGSPGSAAGLRAGDVIMRVNGKAIATPNQWEHVLHVNQGKQVHLTVMRDHHEQTLDMLAGVVKTTGTLAWPDCAFVWFATHNPADLTRELNAAMQQEQAMMLEQIDTIQHEIMHGMTLE